jgi:2-polyprenyl-6-methoxyphenol hydroxylase-like FAD-dependent oxidoreductase
MAASREADAKVLAVGAGPTGLLLAAELARRDVDCLLIDELDAPLGWDRATVVHARSMEIFESLGIVEPFLEEGVRTRAARFRSDGRVLGELDLEANGGRYPFDIGISEEVTERVLAGYLERQGGAVTRSTKLVDLIVAEDGIVATVERDGGRTEVAVDWVVGCDGLHSVVRDAAGIDFPGAAIARAWAVFDAGAEGWDFEQDVVSVQLDVPPVIMTPLPGDRWRVYLRPPSEDSDLVEVATDVVRRYSPKVRFTDVENAASFHCHSRVATSFRSGRALIAGDAAHVCSPAEGHGMNSGLQDAFNLAWKLAHVCRGESGPALLDSYDAERRPVALRVVQSGADTEGGQGLVEDAERAARDEEIERTFADPDSVHHEAAAAAEIDRSYADSPIVKGEPANPVGPGDRLPDLDHIHELTHRESHTLLVFGGTEDDVGAVEEEAAASPHVGAVLGVPDPTVAGRLGLERPTLFAIRPDRYIGLRCDAAATAVLRDYLAGLSGGPSR